MQPIRLTYRGQEHLIPAHRAFAAGAAVEEIVSLAEIASWGDKPKFFKIAMAFGALLRFAGCEVSDAEVHADMMAGLRKAASAGVAEDIPAAIAINALMACLMGGAPPSEPGEDAPEKPTAS
jgi:hypothetical protein